MLVLLTSWVLSRDRHVSFHRSIVSSSISSDPIRSLSFFSWLYSTTMTVVIIAMYMCWFLVGCLVFSMNLRTSLQWVIVKGICMVSRKRLASDHSDRAIGPVHSMWSYVAGFSVIPFAFPVRVLGLYPVGVRYAKFHSEYSQNCDTIGILLLAVRPLICVWYLLATSPTYRDLYMIFWRISFDLSVIRVLSVGC